MARFVSFNGEFFPAIESVTLKYAGSEFIPKEKLNDTIKLLDAEDGLHPGHSFHYKGPDRSAMAMLKEQGVESLGVNFEKDPEFRQMVRNIGYDDVKRYLKDIGFDKDKSKQDFELKATKVSKHELPEAGEEIKILAGGQDKTGNSSNDIIGGFGGEQIRKAKS